MSTVKRSAKVARQVIAAYGGVTPLAARMAQFVGQDASREFIKKLRASIYKWQERGIAGDWRGTVRQMCHADRVDLPQDFDAPPDLPVAVGEQVLDSASISPESRSHAAASEGVLP